MPDRVEKRASLRLELLSWCRAVGFAIIALAALGAAISVGGPALQLLALN